MITSCWLSIRNNQLLWNSIFTIVQNWLFLDCSHVISCHCSFLNNIRLKHIHPKIDMAWHSLPLWVRRLLALSLVLNRCMFRFIYTYFSTVTPNITSSTCWGIFFPHKDCCDFRRMCCWGIEQANNRSKIHNWWCKQLWNCSVYYFVINFEYVILNNYL